MKIAIDARFYGLEHAGLGRYTKNLVDILQKLDTNDNQYLLLLNEKYFNQLKLPNNWKKVLCEYKIYTIKEQLGMCRLLKATKPDLVHFLHLNVPVLYRGRYVVTLHDMTMHNQGRDATTLPFFKYMLKRIPYKKVFRTAVERSSDIIVPSNAVKKELVEYFKINRNKVEVVYEGVDAAYSNTKLLNSVLKEYNLENTDYFIYTGSLYPHKNISKVIDALKLLNTDKKKKTYLVLVSSRNVFSERVKAYAKSQNMDKYVKHLGFVDDNKLISLYKYSIAFIFPSLSEGFGLPGLEAMASGAMVIASDIPVFKEIYKDNAHYFTPNMEESIKNAMLIAINKTQKEKLEITSKAKKFTGIYSWVKTAKETKKVYDRNLTSLIK